MAAHHRQPQSSCPLHELPDVWKTEFLTSHSDGAMRKALFMVCRGCRDWMLRDSGPATLALSLDRSPEQLVRTVNAASSMLSTRGQRPIAVVLRQKEDNAGQAVMALGMLGGPRTHVHSLQLDLANVTRSVLRTAAATFPSLQKLHLGGDTAQAPRTRSTLIPSDLMPNVTELVIGPVARSRQTAMRDGLSLWSQQLVSLRFPGRDDAEHLLTTAMPALRHLQLPEELDNKLVAFLSRCAPALEHLIVPDVSRRIGAVPQNLCSWKTVQFTATSYITLCLLSWLPRSTHPQMEVKLSDGKPCTLYLGNAYSMVAQQGSMEQRLASMAQTLQRFTFPNLNVVCWSRQTFIPQLLQALEPVRALGRTLELWDWQMTADLPGDLSLVLQQWPLVSLKRFHLPNPESPPLDLPPVQVLEISLRGAVESHAWDWLLAHTANVKSLRLEFVSKSQVDLQDRLSPWQEIRAVRPDVASLLRLPARSSSGGPARVTVVDSLVCPLQESIKLVETREFELPSVTLEPGVKLYITNDSPGSPAQAQASKLRDLLQLLGTFKGNGTDVTLEGIALAPEVMVALAGLPQWRGLLGFTRCTWLNDPYLYNQLPQHIPGSFTKWCLGAGLTAQQLHGLCMAAPTDRTAQHPLSVTASLNNSDLSSIQQSLDRWGIWPHVTVAPFPAAGVGGVPESDGDD